MAPEIKSKQINGEVNGRAYTALLGFIEGGDWFIQSVHVGGLPPMVERNSSFRTEKEASTAVEGIIKSL